MSPWDEFAFVIAIVAIVGTLAFLIAVAAHRRVPRSPTPVERTTEAAVEQPIRITFAERAAWRIESLLERRVVIVETFTFRCCDDNQPGPWHHELLDGPVRLDPGESVRIPTIIDGDRWDAVAGWAVVDHGVRHRGSGYLHVQRTDS